MAVVWTLESDTSFRVAAFRGDQIRGVRIRGHLQVAEDRVRIRATSVDQQMREVSSVEVLLHSSAEQMAGSGIDGGLEPALGFSGAIRHGAMMFRSKESSEADARSNCYAKWQNNRRFKGISVNGTDVREAVVRWFGGDDWAGLHGGYEVPPGRGRMTGDSVPQRSRRSNKSVGAMRNSLRSGCEHSPICNSRASGVRSADRCARSEG